MVFQFKNGEQIQGTILVKTKLFCLIKTLDNNFALININELKNNENNNNKQSQTKTDTI